MSEYLLPGRLAAVLESERDPEAVFTAMLPALGEVLECDRCFLYLRNPETRIGSTPYCWWRDSKYPDVTSPEWQEEPASLALEDPLFAAALRAEDSIYVEDVETADPRVVNRAFEQKHFGHRALIHAHLRDGGLLWGILQPCIFERPRVWTAFERAVVAQTEERLAPLAVRYIRSLPA